MVGLERHTVHAVLSLIIILQLPLLEGKRPKQECPIGFQLALTTSKEKICYSLKKDPERFSDKFVNCTGNLFTLKLYNSLSLPKPEGYSLWTDYKSLYPGGPFVDWSYTSSTGSILETTYEVNRDHRVSVSDELCVVIDPVDNFTMVRCNESHYRYCFVEAYTDETSDDGCDELTDGLRFYSPLQTCLATVAAAGGRGGVRATWNQSQGLCEKRGGSVLGRGWRYSNYFQMSGALDSELPMYPLNIVSISNHTEVVEYDNYTNAVSVISPTEWHFGSSTKTKDTSLGAINNNNFWDLVNSTYVFMNVICERPIELKHVKLTVSINSGDDLIKLIVDYIEPHDSNDPELLEDDIICFTDSSRYYPNKVSVKPHSTDSNVYIIKPLENGYYWCTHADSKNFYIAESNKALYIKVKESTENLYAVKIRTFDPYTLDRIGKLLEKVWIKKLEEYVFYSTKYIQTYEGAGSYDNYTVMNFRNEHPGLHWEDKNIVQNKKLKRLYLDAKTALLHVELHPDMKPVKPGQWESILIDYMRPVYYCDKEKKFSLGMNSSAPECKLYKCVGDYNDGVQTIITPQDGCYLPTVKMATLNVVDVTPLMPTIPPLRDIPDITVTPSEPWPRDRSYDSSSSEEEHIYSTTANVTDPEVTTVSESTYEVSTVSNEVLTATSPLRPPPPITPRPPPPTLPTTTESTDQPTTETTLPPTRPPPEDQLALVITNLEELLNNTDPIMVQDIEDVFTQVDEILVLQEELNITGNFLHLLDDIGARIDLNGLDDSFTVRENIALLVADAQPQAPVKGLRVAVRDTDTFTNETFEIIREFNSTQLSTDENEVVVSLPDSVSSSNRRISFVVFRNDRAFQGGHEHFTVNSRVLSVNVENLTEFSPGEVIDIHMMPLTHQLERNQSRSCAFWQFNDDNTGNWSQEGCTFIRASRAGLLDTCRCDHLTHFAEILVPRTVFSEQNEIALEILSVIGCCISILGLLLIGLTAALFRSWRRDYSNKIWLQLCISILILSICFLVVVFAQFQENNILCLLTGVVLHYSVLSSFCWMLVAAVLSYRRLVLVFSRDASHKLLRASAFAWGAPCAVVGILLSVAPHSYAGQYEDKSPSGAFCYPSGLALWLAVYAPITLMLLTNWTLFVLIVRSVFGTRRPQNHGHSGANEAFRCASVSCLLVFLFGLPWLFGLFSFNVVCAYFFTILVTFQGFVLFFFFVLGNKKTRDLWLNKLKIKQTRKIPVTSSTYTNRSTGVNVPSSRGNPTPASIEANASKPRSLNSSDNSRFS